MTDWMKNAPCEGHGHLFFEESRPTVVSRARKLCEQCAFSTQCLEHAIRNNEVGVWAGLTTNQRKKLVRSRGKHSFDLGKIV